jgi:hypothetical protein
MNPNWMPGVAVLMGLALAAPAAASAETREIYETRDRARVWDYRNRSGTRGIGFDKGYDDGLKRGRHDGDHRHRFDPARDKKYRDGDRGYHREYGPRYEYVRGYRQGFEQGYRDGYEAYGYARRDRGYGRDGRGRYDRDDRDRDGRIYEIPRY